jgi:hypothetical protein
MRLVAILHAVLAEHLLFPARRYPSLSRYLRPLRIRSTARQPRLHCDPVHHHARQPADQNPRVHRVYRDRLLLRMVPDGSLRGIPQPRRRPVSSDPEHGSGRVPVKRYPVRISPMRLLSLRLWEWQAYGPGLWCDQGR